MSKRIKEIVPAALDAKPERKMENSVGKIPECYSTRI